LITCLFKHRTLLTYAIPVNCTHLPAAISAPAPASPKEGKASADALLKKVFQEASVSRHDWTGVSAISSYATLPGVRRVKDLAATGLAQIVISGTQRLTPKGAISMPAFGAAIPTPKSRRLSIMSPYAQQFAI
jgi:hypothetical protein